MQGQAHLRLVICHGDGNNFKIIEEGGIKRPFTVVTMDALWWEVAAELELPRLFFTDKLRMMRFCLGNKLLCVTTKDGEEETDAMYASFDAMGAVCYSIHSDKEEDGN